MSSIGAKISTPVEEVKETPKTLPITIEKDGFILFNREGFEIYLESLEVKRSIKYIQNHHTWKPRYSDFDNNHFAKLSGMKRSHLKRGFSNIAQNLTTFPDGMIAVCRPFKTIPAGIKGKNTGSLCIEHLGNFDAGGDTMTEEHRKTILWINAVLCKKFKLEVGVDAVIYHHWFASKSCPGSAFFGGNSKLNAEEHFYPLIRNEK